MSESVPTATGAALWAAAVRARETTRRDALLHDPHAEQLAGTEGRELLERLDRAAPEAAGFVAAVIRCRYIDDTVERLLGEHGIRQLVVLGAGMDTRAFRLGLPPSTTVFEVDQPAVLDVKERRLADAGIRPQCGRRIVPLDLRHDDLAAALSGAGFDAREPAVWVVEGLFVYLADADVDRLLDTLTVLSAPSSYLVGDVVGRAVLQEPAMAALRGGAEALGAPLRFGVDDPAALFDASEWSITAEDITDVARQIGASRARTAALSADRGGSGTHGGGWLLTARRRRAAARATGRRLSADRDAGPIALGICGQGTVVPAGAVDEISVVEIDGYRVLAGFFSARSPHFDATGAHRRAVLVKTTAFSCNYRDKALILSMANTPHPGRFYPVGSELCGRILDVGADVVGLSTGDRVMIDASYGAGPQPWGIPTNHASRSRQVLPAARLRVVPDGMSDVDAAAFSIGAQTAFAMIRRAGVVPGTHVLVTAGSSNTSLFIAQAARCAGADVTLTSTSAERAGRLRHEGWPDVVLVTDDEHPDDEHPVDPGERRFEVVLDPFADLYLRRVLPLMEMGGRYISCGVQRQYPSKGTSAAVPTALLDERGFLLVMSRNLQIVGSCLGEAQDLDDALRAWAEDDLRVPVDTVVAAGDGLAASAATFLSRTFCDPDRFGKVVYRYD